MVSETVQVSCLTNGGAKNNQGFKRKHLGSGELTTASCHDGVSDDKGSIGTSSRHMTANINEDTQPDGVSKKVRLPKELTFQDMYNNQDAFDDDDDEDDSDWEPVQKHIEILKWFCTNCTMVNLDDVVHCDICGEHKESGIVRHGFYASPCSPEVDLIQVESEARGREKDLHSEASASNCSTAVGFDERMLLHSEVEMKSHPHPERPDRLRAIAASLAAAGIFPGKCCPIPAREITHEELQMVHSLEHIETVELTSQIFSSYFTPDTYANEHSAYAARLAAGLCADLASAIFSGCMRNGFALVRPPGHHAGVTQAMGFCLHNNAAVAAFAAQVAGAKKVLIVDWDVHHGNGTQEIFDQNKSVLYISLHRHEGGKFYPGTGAAFEVTPAGYAQMTHMLGTLSNGKLLVILEGGYNLRSISSSATAVIKVLLGESYGCEPENIVPSKAGLHTVLEVLKIQMKYWPTLSSSLEKLQSQWGMYSMENKKKQLKKRRLFEPPLWWRWGRKQLLYHILTGHFHLK
ncbi:histone deacetylase 15 isoform X4 [Durio zibethinus]|uniref:histone deacetylase n=1 Tax=Durio zibethinus TaxID=66656 RepID=A0A6P5Y7Q8_DURZI|nr:histone deacetylase 15 isoform X4 [Durio zibethinus]